MKILAIDLGKFKSTACVLETTSNDHSFQTIRTVAGEMHDLLASHQPDRRWINCRRCNFRRRVCGNGVR